MMICDYEVYASKDNMLLESGNLIATSTDEAEGSVSRIVNQWEGVFNIPCGWRITFTEPLLPGVL